VFPPPPTVFTKRPPTTDELDRTPVIAHCYEFLNIRERAIRKNLLRFAIAAEPAVEVVQPEDHLLLVSVGEKYDMPPWYMLPLLVARLSAVTMFLVAQARGLCPQGRESATRECFPGVLFFTCTQPQRLVTCFLGPLPAFTTGREYSYTIMASGTVPPSCSTPGVEYSISSRSCKTVDLSSCGLQADRIGA